MAETPIKTLGELVNELRKLPADKALVSRDDHAGCAATWGRPDVDILIRRAARGHVFDHPVFGGEVSFFYSTKDNEYRDKLVKRLEKLDGGVFKAGGRFDGDECTIGTLADALERAGEQAVRDDEQAKLVLANAQRGEKDRQDRRRGAAAANRKQKAEAADLRRRIIAAWDRRTTDKRTSAYTKIMSECDCEYRIVQKVLNEHWKQSGARR